MEKRLDIRAFQDGKDYVLVFRDCSPELKDIVKGILHPVSVPDLEAEGISPADEKEEYRPRFADGPLEGRSPVRVLLEDGDEGYRLLRRERPEDIILEYERRSSMALYRALRFRETGQVVDVIGRDDLASFIRTFCTRKNLETFMAWAGYGDEQEFFRDCPENTLRKLIRKMVEK